MRDLDDAKRQQAVQEFEAARRCGCRTGQQEHDTGNEHEYREHVRRELFRESAERGGDAHRLRAALSHFVGDQSDHRNDQREEVVHRAVDHECREQLPRREVRLQKKHHEPFEDADAARHVARHPEQDGNQKCAEEREKRYRASRQ